MQVLKSLDWQKVTVDVVEVAVHSDAEHDGITLFMEAQVSPSLHAWTRPSSRQTLWLYSRLKGNTNTTNHPVG